MIFADIVVVPSLINSTCMVTVQYIQEGRLLVRLEGRFIACIMLAA